MQECGRAAVAPVPAVGLADHRDGVGFEQSRGFILVAVRDRDGGLGDEAHGEDHGALDRQHRWVLAVRRAVVSGVAEPRQLGGQLEVGPCGVEAVIFLEVAVSQGR